MTATPSTLLLALTALASPAATQDGALATQNGPPATQIGPPATQNGPQATPVRAWTADGEDYAAGELLVGLGDSKARAAVERGIAGLGGRVIEAVERRGLLRVRLPEGEAAPAALGRYRRLAGVRYVELNFLGQGGGAAGGPPSDTDYDQQWQLNNTGQSGGSSGADIEVEGAWALESGDPGVVLAVLDTGITFDHPEFQGRTLPGYDFVNEDPDPIADHPHGVYVSALAAANTDNGWGVAGVDRTCRILPVKVLNQFNLGTVFDLVQGLEYCVQERPEVVNLSLINYPRTVSLSDALADARAAGCILISCAGNLGFGDADRSWPGASSDTISIGATDHDDLLAGFSGTGDALDFVAPGEDVVTAVFNPALDGSSLFTGCSAATPLAAGIVTLLKARHPDMDQACAYELLLAGAEDQVGSPTVDAPGWDPFHGHGRLNAARSLAAPLVCPPTATLHADVESISLAAGEVQTLTLLGSASLAQGSYLMLGSASGTDPGTALGAFTLPLVQDRYFRETLTTGSFLVGGAGVLDAEGWAQVVVQPPAGVSALVGLTLHHAYVGFAPGPGAPQVLAVSSAVPLDLN